MPDALAKTIPIWAVVVNRLLFPNRTGHHRLHTSPDIVSRSEHSQIEAKLDAFLQHAQVLRQWMV